ncbi:hypothetical protein CEUSTIGMA_g7790.t1 [Chlamydomonas eustigma]|uniref:Uncharacterized protein n=1 Tax=Chlamydomonas eustigma TaxID=1157962 RepID=A0A250XB90_9CHLO|nr:hypothetical protein CEUSTIGMA_g7790.t1 [Chlamydomonas eustigma]|eukprot:GAX80351.1 hypothetical protein CEUSTIGMA_g7790.t1 [Chlamydomonas eustigma]
MNHCIVVSKYCKFRLSRWSGRPSKSVFSTPRAFADNVPGMSSDNCVTDATTKSILAASATGGGDSSGGGSGRGDKTSKGDGDSRNDSEGSHPMRVWTFIFAALLAAGGAIAYVRKGSTQSLGASLGASFILLLCARSMVGATALSSARVAFGLSLLLGIAMANRYTSSKKIMPAGLVAGSSLLLSIGYLVSGL